VVLFVLGLLAKPMVVTLPLVLILLDFWPLGRVGPDSPGRSGSLSWRRIVLEKLPLLALAAFSAALTVAAQAAGGAIHREIPLALRLQNALVSQVTYLGKTLWPAGLAIFYPHPADGIAGWQVAGAVALLATITAAAVRGLRRAPWVLVGWGWYLVSLLPVLGIVQVGGQGLADRYTYLPLIGIFLAVAWSGRGLARHHAGVGVIAALSSGALLAAWAAVTWVQLGYWKDDVTLFSRALAVTPDNAESRYNLGRGLFEKGRQAEAIVQLRRAVELNPRDEHALNDLGIALSRQGNRTEAVTLFRLAIGIRPSYADPYMNLAMAYLSQRDTRSALAVYRDLRAVDPEAAARLAAFLGPAVK
jgi:tetratricopeptide (TPR) repeat protein